MEMITRAELQSRELLYGYQPQDRKFGLMARNVFLAHWVTGLTISRIARIGSALGNDQELDKDDLYRLRKELDRMVDQGVLVTMGLKDQSWCVKFTN